MRGKLSSPYFKMLCNEDLHDLYSAPNTVRLIKSIWMRWAGQILCMGEQMHIQFWLVNLNTWENVGLDGRMILKFILEELAVKI